MLTHVQIHTEIVASWEHRGGQHPHTGFRMNNQIQTTAASHATVHPAGLLTAAPRGLLTPTHKRARTHTHTYWGWMGRDNRRATLRRSCLVCPFCWVRIQEGQAGQATQREVPYRLPWHSPAQVEEGVLRRAIAPQLLSDSSWEFPASQSSILVLPSAAGEKTHSNTLTQ